MGATTTTEPSGRLRAPKPGTEFRVHDGRLALFHEADDAKEYWSDYWTAADVDRQRRDAEVEGMGAVTRFVDLVPRDRPVLDAGCGTGNHVWAMREHGLDAWGVDYAPRVVERARELFPGCRYEVGDVLALDLADRSVGTYVSLGIVEHFEAGPQQALAEARRVVDDDGLAIVDVPFLNHHRARLLEDLRRQPARPTGRTFHQYYFSAEEMERLLADAGFELVARHHRHAIAFLRREHRGFARFYDSPLARSRVRRAIRTATERMPLALGDRYTHMMTFVARPVR